MLVLVVEWTHTDRQTERQNRQTRPTDQPTPTPPRDARTLAGKHLAERLLELFHLGRHLLVAILSVWGSCFGGGQMVSVGVWIDKRLLVGAGVVVWGRGDVVVVASQGSSSLSVGVLIHNTINQPTPPSSTKVSTRTYMAVTASACLTGTMATWPGTRAATPLPEPAPVGVRWRRRACSPVVVGVVVVGWGGVGGGVTRREWGMVGQGGKGGGVLSYVGAKVGNDHRWKTGPINRPDTPCLLPCLLTQGHQKTREKTHTPTHSPTQGHQRSP